MKEDFLKSLQNIYYKRFFVRKISSFRKYKQVTGTVAGDFKDKILEYALINFNTKYIFYVQHQTYIHLTNDQNLKNNNRFQ